MSISLKFKWMWWRLKHFLGFHTYVPNPMLKYPRNIDCWCGSKKKAKLCCLPKQAIVCDYAQAKVLQNYIGYVKNYLGV